MVWLKSRSLPTTYYGIGTSRQRHDHSHCPSGVTAIESSDPGDEPPLRHQSEDGSEVAYAQLRRGCANGAGGKTINGGVAGGGSSARRLSDTPAVAAGGLAPRRARDNPPR